ncbi:MAG: hypothetical protein CL897_04520 [Dehalococcoidia bacterium]|nr:hypothetical protein [Dehalococcoidia bacterium]HCV00926.1 hypothetical protein [Dehalococcoidia bacterium]|tara:strand:- start:125 stop:589 length:465 start_codon:yes stop_codon:yes gene_type:complete
MKYEDMFHVGIIVPDLESGLAEIAKRFGVTFPDPPPTQGADVLVKTSAGEMQAEVIGVYSAEGPPYLEVIRAIPGTPWEAGEGSRIHHLGAFVDDLDDEVARLTAEGVELEATLDVGGGVMAVSYLNGPLGVRQELLPGHLRDGMLANLRGEGA